MDCTAHGLGTRPAIPMFAPGKITPQSLVGGFTTYHAALVAYLEATRADDTERNRLCPPVGQIALPLDWVAMMRGFLVGGALHGAEPDLAEWIDRSRLGLTYGLSQQLADPAMQTALARWADNGEAVLKNADEFLTPAA